ncbi:MAG: hypothetical protein MJZ34_02240 [Paludibacteraceae bacterium]|nr:hypothetical protein [Paludibacteraceae bacterium]
MLLLMFLLSTILSVQPSTGTVKFINDQRARINLTLVNDSDITVNMMFVTCTYYPPDKSDRILTEDFYVPVKNVKPGATVKTSLYTHGQLKAAVSADAYYCEQFLGKNADYCRQTAQVKELPLKVEVKGYIE